jgi:ABC-type antimicrobial peptide transport system permease subunit
MALINLMNMMLTRSLRRQAALGILMAMGASRQVLVQLQAVEGVTMASTGTVIGLIGSVGLYQVLHEAGRNLFGITQSTLSINFGAYLICAPIMILLSLGMAIIPALMGSRLSTSSALKAE